ncbi:TetR/AcrR family transcriptional regulator [Cohnella nanjingensis]|uniref:TetR/AcrR family transcriptional regulator n=1 Tax=Cohnella nanjingensis TaxID=1387779 RepID=A0A7X0RVU4_9BACL|nr:TetR/AcrR family transcriptional regulator [Cohnella nanjingensis]MBB6674563.1 TetR/AcrR family transcriptional regulator [Cohnella nanjingensis]
MSDKKVQIIEAAMRCFSRKGFHATSIQEIVDELGMAKGSIYFYFKSKEELLQSVFWHYAERMMSGMSVLPEERHLPPRDQFRLQLKRRLAFFRDNRELLLMLVREPHPATNQQETFKLMLGIRARTLKWKQQHIEAIYGPSARPYAWEGAALLGGMFQELMHTYMLGQPPFDGDRMIDYLLLRLDDIMDGLIGRGGAPLIDPEVAEIAIDDSPTTGAEQEIRRLIRELLRLAEQSDEREIGAERRSDMVGVASRLEDELTKPIPDRFIVRGMLAYMKELAIPAWREPLEALVKKMHPQ